MMDHLEALPFAIRAALESRCQSQRGVVIWDGHYGVISTGYNHQPKPFLCDGSDRCKKTCGKTAIHAEQHAILSVGPRDPVGASMLHVKITDGLPVACMAPSCLECSKLILEAGIAFMWLLHPKGWRCYTAAEFHYETAAGWHRIELLYNKGEAPPGTNPCAHQGIAEP